MPNRLAVKIGDRFGRLVVLGRDTARDSATKDRKPIYLCRCDCGNTASVRSAHLRTGGTSSCGCGRKEWAGDRVRSHGKTGSKVYHAWRSMLDRCTNPNVDAYRSYGAKGVTVCEAWLGSFEEFYAYVGDPPTAEHSIDRVRADGNYEPGNVRWSTAKEQQRNKRNTTWVHFQGRQVALQELAEVYGVPAPTLRYRLKAAWPVWQALGLQRVRRSRAAV